MTTNANGESPSTPDSAPDKPARNKKFSWDAFSTGFGVILFFGCWVLFGVVIFNHLTGIGTSVVLAVLAAVIGGFIAAVIAWIVGMSGISI